MGGVAVAGGGIAPFQRLIASHNFNRNVMRFRRKRSGGRGASSLVRTWLQTHRTSWGPSSRSKAPGPLVSRRWRGELPKARPEPCPGKRAPSSPCHSPDPVPDRCRHYTSALDASSASFQPHGRGRHVSGSARGAQAPPQTALEMATTASAGINVTFKLEIAPEACWYAEAGAAAASLHPLVPLRLPAGADLEASVPQQGY